MEWWRSSSCLCVCVLAPVPAPCPGALRDRAQAWYTGSATKPSYGGSLWRPGPRAALAPALANLLLAPAAEGSWAQPAKMVRGPGAWAPPGLLTACCIVAFCPDA